MVRKLHSEQLEEHGGGAGTRDEGLLQSALARPENLIAYGGEDIDAAALAAAYAFGIARNHPFVDGNKRTAAVTALLFLTLNGIDFDLSNPELTVAFTDLAAGHLLEDELAAWFRDRIITDV